MRRHRPAYPSVFHCLCGKVYAPTRDEARRLRQEMEHHAGNRSHVRFYQCDKGAWHWTRQTERTPA